MSPSPEVRIGEWLRFYRQGKGKTQAVVAGLGGVSEDYLSPIERGLKTPTLTVLRRFSKIPRRPGVGAARRVRDRARRGGPPDRYAVQRALMSYPKAGSTADLAVLRERVDEAWSIWQGSPHRYTEASRVLPDLITDVAETQRSLSGTAPAGERREAARISADMYFLLRTFAKRIGRTDLSLLVADRGVLAAEAADDPVRIAGAKWNPGHILLVQGEADGAEEVAVHAIEELEREAARGDRDAIGMTGALWLVSAVAAVRNNDPWTARDRLHPPSRACPQRPCPNPHD